ncbi:hypothetical protein AVEN_225489-1 [Araneus ventricosus]|uniref:Uncharacterized protein n=1 Tax=Araneus ventricosus TaxID=182803 RepID=A0A4Y2KR40_ARAVE|nr:hypothetical protein AVEN_225489-1 [Araneus ventricosus]
MEQRMSHMPDENLVIYEVWNCDRLAGAIILSYSSARPSPTVRSTTEKYRPTIHGKGGECSFCWHKTLDARGKKSDSVHCLYALAGYNGMTFTPWVTLPGEKLQTYIVHSTQGHHPRQDEAA